MFVLLTIDVECYHGDYQREVYAGGLGLDYVLDALGRHAARATFFVEALGATRWGTDGLQGVCDRVRGAGHDLQLHVHPVVGDVEGVRDVHDILWMHDLHAQEKIIRTGLEMLRRCGADAVTAFRAGDFAADLNTLAAMERTGLFVSSNRNLDTKTSVRSRINDAFPHANDFSRVGRVCDLPVTCLLSPFPRLDGRYRHMEIAAMGLAEMTDGLERMALAGYRCATVFTHPGEFFLAGRRRAVPVPKNRRRLEGLLAFLRSRPDMEILTVAECPRRIAVPDRPPPAVALCAVRSAVRVAEQAVNRLRTRCLGPRGAQR